MTNLPPYITRELISERLPLIFPPGLTNRGYLIRQLSASTIFTMLYIGAIEGNEVYLGPVHVYRMTHEQASKSDYQSRVSYSRDVLKKGFSVEGDRWYEDNTREPIRDETIKDGLVQIGVVGSLNLPTTSGKPRYFLKKSFADLFNPDLRDEELTNEIERWQDENISKAALTRLKLVKHSSSGGLDKVKIELPNGETRLLSPGPSSEISKSVIEVFASKFLETPAVLWLSTSDNKVVQRDNDLAKDIGIRIEADKNLPDIILVDLAPKNPVIVFIEVVATDGPINERRKGALLELTDSDQFERSSVAFVTAYLDRESAAFKKTVSSLAWDSFAWFVSEPEKLIIMKDGEEYLHKRTNFH
ncbi:MAG: restriction endonuclease [Bacteroidetes bacterium]|nr:restriction endonuclease [Bacteroidota bacterium]